MKGSLVRIAARNGVIRRLVAHPWPPWKVLIPRLKYEIIQDNVFGRAAELAYFALLSAFPLLLILTSLLGLLAEGVNIRGDLLRYASRVMPPEAFHLVANALEDIAESASGGKLSVGIILTIFASSSGMVAIIEGLNTAYNVRDARVWWKRRLVAVALTLTLSVFSVLALAIVLYGSQLGHFTASLAGLEVFFESIWAFAQWPLVAAFVLVAFALIYRFGPNVREQQWWWVVPGAVLGFCLWFAASFGLRIYLSFFGDYNKVDGSLGAVIALMLWFYFLGVSILVGGEFNSIIENFAARAGDPEAKLAGEKAPGEISDDPQPATASGTRPKRRSRE